MSPLMRRLIRLWGQSRIRLPRPTLRPEEISAGDRLQIGSAAWRVRGRLPLPSGGWMFRLEAVGEAPAERTGRLVVDGSAGSWVLVLDGEERILPPECVVLHAPF